MIEYAQLIFRLILFGIIGVCCAKKNICYMFFFSLYLIASYLGEIIDLLGKMSCEN